MENQNLTKKERYLLKKQEKENGQIRKERGRKIKKMAAILLPVFLIAGGISFILMNYSSGENNSGTPRIEITPVEYDVGTVSMAGEKVKRTYEIKNTGVGDLKIDKIWTSCMCTTARLRIGDEESGEFGMHSNSVLWSQKIAPGETGFLEVVFDQALHGLEGIGPIVRAVYLSTNDPENKQTEVRLTANVTQ
ncbi:MAG: DUF1573 domain-containing protein [bacterium]|nr:DUF1573 domain-containing protein [bacterium]